MEIRHLSFEDAALYQEMRLEALRTKPELFYRTYEEEAVRSLQSVEKMLRERNYPNNFILGIFKTGRLVGMIGFHQNEPQNLRHRGYIYGLYIRQGEDWEKLAGLLVNEVIAKVKKLPVIEQINVSSVSLWENQLYSKFGFEKVAIFSKALKINEAYVDETFYTMSTKN
jgi:Acetyltransferase (GNAT) domain